MKYKVGDKVRVRKDLIAGREYGGLSYLPSHKKYCGRILTIEESKGGDYQLINGGGLWWSEEMLEDVESGVMIKIYVDGNIVAAQKDDKVGIAKCSPEDKFNIFTGAKLALERLEEQCKPYAWLKGGVRYYYPSVSSKTLVDSNLYIGDTFDERIKERGLAFKTEEEAIEVSKKMLAVLKEG